MTPQSFLLLLAAISCEVVATSSLKASEGFTRLWPSAVVLLGYGAAFFFLGLCLKTIPIGVAYAIWSGVGTAAIAVIGRVAFGEALGAPQIAGIGLVIAGVVVLNLTTRAHGT